MMSNSNSLLLCQSSCFNNIETKLRMAIDTVYIANEYCPSRANIWICVVSKVLIKYIITADKQKPMVNRNIYEITVCKLKCNDFNGDR